MAFVQAAFQDKFPAGLKDELLRQVPGITFHQLLGQQILSESILINLWLSENYATHK